MKKTIVAFVLLAALVLSLTACGTARPTETEAPAVEPQSSAPQSAEPQESEPVRQDGERFEAVIILEGMEEPVQYEHIRNTSLGFEMDYDYENFVRSSDAERERFVSVWDDPANPENYLEITFSAEDAETAAAAVREALSASYELNESVRELERAGSCIRIEASVIKGTNNMADQIQVVTIIPAAEGCCVAAEHYFIESAEGIGRRFSYMLNTLSLLEK